MSMLGWWMVHTMVRPVFTMLRTVRMTMAAALASKPAQAMPSDTVSQHVQIVEYTYEQLLTGQHLDAIRSNVYSTSNEE